MKDLDAAAHNRGRGKAAEDRAVAWLVDRGYSIVERNLTTHAGEIDVVARDGDTLCFIEVKARSGQRYGPAISAVGYHKQERLRRAAALYLAMSGFDGPCRFDVVGLDRGGKGWEFTLVRDAF